MDSHSEIGPCRDALYNSSVIMGYGELLRWACMRYWFGSTRYLHACSPFILYVNNGHLKYVDTKDRGLHGDIHMGENTRIGSRWLGRRSVPSSIMNLD